MSHKPRKLDKGLIVIDLIALFLSFLVALRVRFGEDIAAWQMQLYSTLIVAELMITVMIHFYRMPRRKNPSITLLDPIDIFVETGHNQIILLAGMALFLMATQSSQRVSRLAVLYMFLGNVVFVYILRMIYWAIRKHRRQHTVTGRRLLVVTDAAHLRQVIGTLRATLSVEDDIYGYCLIDEGQAAGKRERFHDAPNDGDTARGTSAETYAADVGSVQDNLEFCGYIPGSLRPAGPDTYTEAFIYLPGHRFNEVGGLVDIFNRNGVNVSYSLSVGGNDLAEQMLTKRGSYETILYSSMAERCEVLNVPYAITNLDSAVNYVKTHVQALSGQYLCFSNVHTTVMAKENKHFLKIMRGAAVVFPDGAPVAKQIKKYGYEEAGRVPGPDFMGEMFRATMDGKVSHFFYGSTQKTLDLLRENLEKNYPGIDIRGMYSPPFRALTPEEDRDIIDMINASGADIIWIGLGAPKQERWMAAHKGMLKGVCAGVGAGFNFHAGNIRRAPYWVQKIGMEWLYRLIQDPRRLFSRYLVTNSKYIWYIMKGRKRSGKE